MRPHSLLMTVALACAAATLGACNDDDELTIPQPGALNDAQVAGVTLSANRGEIDQATMYLARGRNAEARAFATEMQVAHATALNRQEALYRSLGLTPAPSETQAQLETDASQITAVLQVANVQTLDRTYIDSQVQAHTEVLQIIDEQLIPSATIPELQQELTGWREEIAAHLAEARDIQARFQAANPR